MDTSILFEILNDMFNYSGGVFVAVVTYFFMRNKGTESTKLIGVLLAAFVLGSLFSPFVLVVFFILLRGKNVNISTLFRQAAEGNLAMLDHQKEKMSDKIDQQFEKGRLSIQERDLKKKELDQKLAKIRDVLQANPKKDKSGSSVNPFTTKKSDQPFEIPDKDNNPFF